MAKFEVKYPTAYEPDGTIYEIEAEGFFRSTADGQVIVEFYDTGSPRHRYIGTFFNPRFIQKLGVSPRQE